MALAAGAGRMGGQKPLPPAPCLGLPFAPSSSPVLLPVWLPGVTVLGGWPCRDVGFCSLAAGGLGQMLPALNLSPPAEMRVWVAGSAVPPPPPVQTFWLCPLPGEANSLGRGGGGG